jgi:hypothetical protein
VRAETRRSKEGGCGLKGGKYIRDVYYTRYTGKLENVNISDG